MITLRTLNILVFFVLLFVNPLFSQHTDICDALELGQLTTFTPTFDCPNGPDEVFMCVTGNNLNGIPDQVLSDCQGENDPVFWYTFETDSESLLNITASTGDFGGLTIKLFSSLDQTCESISEVLLTDDQLPCMVGSQGKLIANGTPLSPGIKYFLSVGGVKTVGGDFELCIASITVQASCVLSSSLNVTSRNFGGPLEGPFFPTEVVSICMNVEAYTAAGNGCQWFQGIVPVFGAGWDSSSFDGAGKPLGATLNGNVFPANNLFNAGQWDWWTTASYHHPHCYYNIGDFDGNGTLDMCNSLYDPYCVGPGLESSTGSGPCWYDQDPGPILPGGWFTSGVDGNCPSIGYPGVDWGDGNSCNGTVGPWSFCFDLTVRADCDSDATASDLSIGFTTFADGETGAWDGGASICGLDQSIFKRLPLCCNEIVSMEIEMESICSGSSFLHILDDGGIDESVEYWEWTVESTPNVIGWAHGEGAEGEEILDTLINLGFTQEIIKYTLIGYANGVCPLIIKEFEVEVIPQIELTLVSDQPCNFSIDSVSITPQIIGGSGTYEYTWGDQFQGIERTIINPIPGSIYILTVTDDEGCYSVDSIVIGELLLDILASATEQCAHEGSISLSAIPVDGLDSTHIYNWTLPGGEMREGQTIEVLESGQYEVIITDEDGCQGRDSVELNFFESPEVQLSADHLFVCPDDTVQIETAGFGGLPPYTYNCIGANLSDCSVTTPGVYYVQVTDGNGCSSIDSIEIDQGFVPIANFSFEINGGEVQFIDQSSQATSWSWIFGNGQTSDAQNNTIEFEENGTYPVTLVSSNGCGSDTLVQNIQIMTTATYQHKEESIKVFPIPASDFLYITHPLLIDGDIEIYDLLGRSINLKDSFISQNSGRFKINISELEVGVYTMVIFLQGKRSISQFVIQR